MPSDQNDSSPLDHGPVGQDIELPERGPDFYHSVYTARPNDCIVKIAGEKGFWWETLWNHADNADARSRRKNPNVVRAGDRWRVPEPEPKTVEKPTEEEHVFVLKNEPSILRLRVAVCDEPLANEPYKLVIGETEIEGTTDGDGQIEEHIPSGTTYAELTVGEEPDIHEYQLQIGAMDPIDTITGVKARLNNMGFAAGEIIPWQSTDVRQDKTLRRALRRFQLLHGLTPTGLIDEDTLDKLEKRGI